MSQLPFPKRPGAALNARLPLPRATPINNKRLRAATFKSSQIWNVPKNVNVVRIAVGKGQDGQPASGAHDYVDGYNEFTQHVTFDSAGNGSSGPNTFVGTFTGSPVPSDYCDPPTITGPGMAGYTDCYTFSYTTVDVGDYVPPSTGANTTGVNRTFAGGVGIPAVAQTFYNIPVTPGASMPITVAPGGSLTIYF